MGFYNDKQIIILNLFSSYSGFHNYFNNDPQWFCSYPLFHWFLRSFSKTGWHDPCMNNGLNDLQWYDQSYNCRLFRVVRHTTMVLQVFIKWARVIGHVFTFKQQWVNSCPRKSCSGHWNSTLSFRCWEITNSHCNENPTYAFLFLGIPRPEPQFPHSCVCERFI